MSAAINAKSARARATIAANMLKKQKSFGRAFDDCFEMGDADQVMDHLIEKARKDRSLALALRVKMPGLGFASYNTRMHQAINECLENKD